MRALRMKRMKWGFDCQTHQAAAVFKLPSAELLLA
jgi:hypothetical protein